MNLTSEPTDSAPAILATSIPSIILTGSGLCSRFCSFSSASVGSAAKTSGWTCSSGVPRRSSRSISRIRSRSIPAFSYASASATSAICFFNCRRMVERFDFRNFIRSLMIFLYSCLSILAAQGAAHCFMLYRRQGRKNLRFGSASLIVSLQVRNLNIFCSTTKTALRSFAPAKGPNNLLPLGRGLRVI
ncbi:hypothetical protein ES703_119553 [subsurface metagenome]